MKYLYFFPLVLFLACSSNTDLVDTSNSSEAEEYYLNFDINETDFLEETFEDTSYIKTTQDLSHDLVFTDMSLSKRYIPFLYNLNLPEDSIAILGTIKFNINEGFDFEHEEWQIELLLTESKINLTTDNDSTYRYISNETLYNQLELLNWGNKQFGSYEISQLLLTIPEVAQDGHGWGISQISSNGFFLPHEQLELTHIKYAPQTDDIRVQGFFEVELKELSCGWYPFYHVRDAEFSLKIK